MYVYLKKTLEGADDETAIPGAQNNHGHACNAFRFHLLELMRWLFSGDLGHVLPQANKERDSATPEERKAPIPDLVYLQMYS